MELLSGFLVEISCKIPPFIAENSDAEAQESIVVRSAVHQLDKMIIIF